MKFRNALVLTFLLIFSCCPFASAQGNPAAEIDKYMKPLAEKQQFSGVVLASYKGKVIFEKAFGHASAELGVAIRVNTKFNIASITKAFTKLIVIQMIQDKKLGIQDKLSKFIPDFPRGDDITVEMLLRHRSGLPSQILRDEEESLNFSTAEMVERAKLAKLAFEPGKDRLYSSTGYTVLSRILEIVSGKSYEQLLQEMVFGPAAMHDSVKPDGVHFISGRAQDYLLERDGIVPAELKNYTSITGAGSVFSTARDVYNFGNAVLAGTFGDGVKQSVTSNGVYDDNGNTNGFRCFTKIDSVKGFGFVLVSNVVSGANDMIIRDLPEILQGKPVQKPAVSTPAIVSGNSDDPHDLLGSYDSNGSKFEAVIKQGKLYAGRYRLFPLGKDLYYSYGHYAEIKFNRDAAGKVISSEWTSPVWKLTWMRK